MPNLVGIGLSQVPTNSMLGGLAYQDPENASIKDLDLKNLSQINSEISDTATDIFVYDTRKDSDGGAWRKRTQHTSWYNETLGTSTRGTRREFPAVAVIVAEQNFIKIYDGDDPDLPMWMIFNVGSQGMANTPMVQLQNVDKVVYALNGILVTGTKNENSNYGQPVINFISEKVLRMDSQSGEGGKWMGTIAQRNDTIGYQSVDYDYVIAASQVNDVAMTVLPNARIDDATGLPVPTIAVATGGGVSIIKDDESVADLTYQESSNRIVRMIDIDSNGRIYWSTRETGSAPGVYFHEADLPAADSSSEPPVNISTNQAGANNAVKPTLISGSIRDVIRTKDRTVLSLSGYDNKGHLNLYNVTGNVNSSGGLDNFEMVDISTDYNTGYIIGDIKGAFLSDTDTTNITGSNLVDNGDFGTGNFTNWSIGGDTTPTIASGGAKISTAAAIDGYIWQSTSGEAVGGKWMISWTLTANTSGFVGLVINGTQPANGSSYSSGGTLIKDSITSSGFHTYTGTITAVEFRHRGGGGGHAIIDNITLVRLGDEDRSVNENGLQVFGTVTKSAVATGAELVAYSGFTDDNYLRQPYNSDLEFGTGDYYMSIWAKGGGDGQCLMIREHGVSSGNGIDADGAILIFQSSGKYNFYSRQNGTANWTAFSATNATYGNYWSHVVLVRAGGILYGYVNGKLEGSTSFAGNVTNDDAEIYIGRRNTNVNNTQEYSGSLALAKIGGSAPSPEQIKKIYEDEKHLFQENAKCTLYGSPSNVTAIAYDDSTNILYAGTAVGRSEFQGLRRINNTTTAVTTAISASNGLVAEQ